MSLLKKIFGEWVIICSIDIKEDLGRCVFEKYKLIVKENTRTKKRKIYKSFNAHFQERVKNDYYWNIIEKHLNKTKETSNVCTN